jgi:hypothetical protein
VSPAVPVSATGDYNANVGEIVVADKSPSGLQTITLPTNPANGAKVVVVRGANTGNIRVAPPAGASISGITTYWTAQAVNTAYIAGNLPGSQKIELVATSSTTWVPVSADGFYPNTSGWAAVFNDLWVTGSLFWNYQLIMSNVTTVNAAANITQATSVVLAGGTGAYNLTVTAASIGQLVFIKNNSSGTVTIVPEGIGTIDGAATLPLLPTKGALLLNTTGGANGSWTQLAAV